MTGRLAGRALAVLGAAGWVLFAYLTLTVISGSAASDDVFQVDWHVYRSAAEDLVARDLYRVPLDADDRSLSTPHYNLPPFSTVWALPLLGLPVSVGGSVWQLVAAASIALAALVTMSVLRVRQPLLTTGLLVGPLALTLVYLEGLHLATNNYLVLALVAGFAWLYLRGSEAPAGVMLGLAIATKLWPAVLLIPAARERRWMVVVWAIGTALLLSALLFAWLGFDAVVQFVQRLGTAIPPTGFLIGPSAVDGLRETWIGGLGLLVGVVILALPLRGPAAIGAAVLAGMAVIPNLWIHYGPTVGFAVALIGGAVILAPRNPSEDDKRRDPRNQQQRVSNHEHRGG